MRVAEAALHRARTALVLRMRDAAKLLKDTSERLGDQAAALVSRNEHETTLIASGGAGSGRFDHVTIGGDPPVLNIYEAKGGTSRLGYRTVDGVRVQQGTSSYLKAIAEIDPRFADLMDNPAIKKAIEDGSLTVEYSHVRALPDGRIKVSKFEIDVTARDLFGKAR